MNEVTIPNGRYNAVVADHSLAESTNTGTQSVKLKIELVTNFDTGKDAQGTLWHDLWLSEKAMKFTLDTLYKVLDWEGFDIKELNNGEVLQERPVVIEVKNEVWEKKSRPKIKYLGKTFGMTRKSDDELDEMELVNRDIMNYRQDNNMPEPGLPI